MKVRKGNRGDEGNKGKGDKGNNGDKGNKRKERIAKSGALFYSSFGLITAYVSSRVSHASSKTFFGMLVEPESNAGS